MTNQRRVAAPDQAPVPAPAPAVDVSPQDRIRGVLMSGAAELIGNIAAVLSFFVTPIVHGSSREPFKTGTALYAARAVGEEVGENPRRNILQATAVGALAGAAVATTAIVVTEGVLDHSLTSSQQSRYWQIVVGGVVGASGAAGAAIRRTYDVPTFMQALDGQRGYGAGGQRRQ